MEKENPSGERQVTFLGKCGALTLDLATKISNIRMLLNTEDDYIRELAAPAVLHPCFPLPGRMESE